jgi:hypothetical protein
MAENGVEGQNNEEKISVVLQGAFDNQKMNDIPTRNIPSGTHFQSFGEVLGRKLRVGYIFSFCKGLFV